MVDSLPCGFCHRDFVPNRFTPERQRCCGRRRCIRALDAERQARHRERHWDDEGRKALEVARVQRYRQRQKCKAQAAGSDLVSSLALLGLVSQTLGHPAAEEVHEYVANCIERGRRVADERSVSAVRSRGP